MEAPVSSVDTAEGAGPHNPTVWVQMASLCSLTPRLSCMRPSMKSTRFWFLSTRPTETSKSWPPFTESCRMPSTKSATKWVNSRILKLRAVLSRWGKIHMCWFLFCFLRFFFSEFRLGGDKLVYDIFNICNYFFYLNVLFWYLQYFLSTASYPPLDTGWHVTGEWRKTPLTFVI